MLFGALGDIHGDFASMRRVMGRHPDVPFWLSIGDVADDRGRYEASPAPLHWIKGNNEGFDVIADEASRGAIGNLHYLPNAAPATIGGVRVVGLGGTFAPTWYETRAADLPHPARGTARSTELADKRRHFVREEVEACKTLRGIDVFLTHEAPRPFAPSSAGSGRRGPDAGKTAINEVLAAMRPRLHLFGHHHRFAELIRSGVRSICLDLVSRSYLLIDDATMEYEKKEF